MRGPTGLQVPRQILIGSKVQGLGFRVSRLGFRVHIYITGLLLMKISGGSGFRVSRSGFRV